MTTDRLSQPFIATLDQHNNNIGSNSMANRQRKKEKKKETGMMKNRRTEEHK